MWTDRGVDCVGPLPGSIQNRTRYEASRFRVGGEAAADFLKILDAPQADSGVEPLRAS